MLSLRNVHDIEVYDSTFASNRADLWNGLLWLREANRARVFRCTFDNNMCTSCNGGAMGTHTVHLVHVENCTFTDNNVTAMGFRGGHGGAVSMFGSLFFSKVVASNFSNNGAQIGGGAISAGGPCLYALRNCNFENNWAKAKGGAVNLPAPGEGCLDEAAFYQEFYNNPDSPWTQTELRALQRDRRIGFD